jgi:hypothetical protein
MKEVGNLWWLFAIIEVVSTFLNPYVGVFGFFNLVELLFLATLFFILFVNNKILKKNGMDYMLRVSIKSNVNMLYIISVVFLPIKIFIGVAISFLSYIDNKIAAPYEIWSNPRVMSVIFFVLEMIFNVLLVVSLISKGKSIKRMVNEYE